LQGQCPLLGVEQTSANVRYSRESRHSPL